MDELLRPVKTKIIVVEEIKTGQHESPKLLTARIESPEDALQILKDSPSWNQVQEVLILLTQSTNGNFNIKQPGALTAQLIQALVTQTLPDFWTMLKKEKTPAPTKSMFTAALFSVSGIGALLSRLKVLTMACSLAAKPGQTSISPLQLRYVLEVLEEILRPETMFTSLWSSCVLLGQTLLQRTVLWKEFVSLVASGKLMSSFAEAEDLLKRSGEKYRPLWVPKGSEYTRWLARNVSNMIKTADTQGTETFSASKTMCSKALTIGYSDIFVDELLFALVLEEKDFMPKLKKLVQSLHAYEQKSFLRSVLRSVSKISPKIAGFAAVLHSFLSHNEILLGYLVELVTNLESSPLIGTDLVRRIVLACIATDEDRMSVVMEKSMEQFGDQMFVKHAPMVQQEARAQILLISSGYVHRKRPMLLFTLAKSSTQMHGVSNRLKSTSSRARWLGMIVGMTMSSLTDKETGRLAFTDETLETPEAQWYRHLPRVNDHIGKIDDIQTQAVVQHLHSTSQSVTTKTNVTNRLKTTKIQAGPRQGPSTSVISGPRVVELDDETDEDDDLVPYGKPDSDPEDDDEDPTLVDRNKPRPPVYIRDLIAGLRDTERYDRHRLALTTAASLIRRKANFGKEVSDHAEELVSIIAGLHDHFDMEDFLTLRQSALIAILVAQPTTVAQYLARSCFEGDFSLQQRTAMFTALGLGARELAGFKDNEEARAPEFPSKKLPEHLDKVYRAKQLPSVVKVAEGIEQSMIQPMALQAADQLTGPNALKVRTFSSRMAVEKARKKPIPNELAKIVAHNFFFPLTGRWWTQVQSFGNQSVAFSTHLLPIYLRTLAILLHASGLSTLALPQMTSELWDMLLSLRNNALNDNDVGVLESLLFALLTLLEVNEDKQRLATEHAKELVETQEWARLVLEKREAGAGGGGEEEKVRVLAAAVIVRCHEVIERWQRLMLGDMVDM
ncbi:Telomere length regulation protein [Venturia nashicola]|uniref:Telomere length regulation protein n=1 Tax=Venturia nashicola TaxID=86259 RepID=A0A4Z1NSD5_9PEZI|nr:Telomere length regulation protein [Venturia nashicola]